MILCEMVCIVYTLVWHLIEKNIASHTSEPQSESSLLVVCKLCDMRGLAPHLSDLTLIDHNGFKYFISKHLCYVVAWFTQHIFNLLLIIHIAWDWEIVRTEPWMLINIA